LAVREPLTGTMQSLVYDKSSMPWDKSRGFIAKEMPLPVLDESLDPSDAENVLVKVVYAGFCGSDRGIWNRTAFKGMIFDDRAGTVRANAIDAAGPFLSELTPNDPLLVWTNHFLPAHS